jgi:hypothetical protein
MDMTSIPFRNLLCAATLAVLGLFGTSAQATLYDLGWDPAMFVGDVRVNIDPSCLVSDGLKSCLVSPVSGDFFDSIGREWGVGPGPATLDMVSIVGGKLFALDATFSSPIVFLISDSAGCGDGPGPTLTFTITPKQTTFSCGSLPVADNTAIYTSTAVAVPEPATLALLGLGLGIAGLAGSRRRKPR